MDSIILNFFFFFLCLTLNITFNKTNQLHKNRFIHCIVTKKKKKKACSHEKKKKKILNQKFGNFFFFIKLQRNKENLQSSFYDNQ
jgi:cell division protein YceG involved in septum cleavage